MQITKNIFLAGCRVLIDNGVEIDEAQVVMQALFYVMHDKETEQFMVDEIPCCQNCADYQTVCGEVVYHKCNIHDLEQHKFKT